MLLVGSVISLCFITVNGQTTLGVKGGVNIATASVAHMEDDGYKPRVSAHGGVYVNRMFNKYFAIQPEVFFSGEGRRYMFNSVEHTTLINYLEIPLMLQVYPIKDLYIEAGPQFGLLLSARDKLTGQDHRPDLKADFASAQFSVATGVGFRLVDRVVIYGRYNFGLTDVYSYDATIIQHSNVGQIGVAIRLKTL